MLFGTPMSMFLFCEFCDFSRLTLRSCKLSATRIIFGCGYLGSRVAKLWQAVGDHSIAFTRRDDPTEAMIEAGMFTGQADVTQPETLDVLQTVACPGRHAAGVAPLRRRLRSHRPAPTSTRSTPTV